MQQVLFTVPIFKETFPPDGIPFYGFGAMLFVAFIAALIWGTVRAKRIGMEATRFQDFMIALLVFGIIGARIVYIIQYRSQFPDDPLLVLASFFKIWEGGIVFYGSALGGLIGYGLFYWFVMRRFKVHVSGWQLADAVAPLMALGLAIGRIGCYLNGCCWGQVAIEDTSLVPLGSAHFPMLPAHARPQLVSEKLLQTSTGFAIAPRGGEDPRALVTFVEKGSPAQRAGVRPGDRIARINDQSALVASVTGSAEEVQAAIEAMKTKGGAVIAHPGGETRIEFPDLQSYRLGRDAGRAHADVAGVNRLDEMARDWPRGKSELKLSVERTSDAKEETVDLPPFAPKTVGLYPTQLYETLSMILLIFVLLAYYPYRRHDGQLMVVVMIGYAIHRFINESLRIEPSYTGLTLSQWGSVMVFGLAVVMEIYLWRVMPSRWRGEPQYIAQPVASQAQAQSTTQTRPADPTRP